MKRIISSLGVVILVLTTLSFGAATGVSAVDPTCTISDLGRISGFPNRHKIVFSAVDLPTTQSYNVSLDWRGHQNILEQDFSLDGGSNGSWDSGDINIDLTPPPTNQVDLLGMIIKNKVTGKTACTNSLMVSPTSEDEFSPGLPASNTSGQSGSNATTNPTNAQCTPAGGPANSGIQTALGCIKADISSLANTIFGLILGLAGGLAILLIIIGGFKVAMSQGDPDALQDGRDMITHAVTGLVFILLATTILGIIGIDILGLGRFFQRTPGGITITP